MVKVSITGGNLVLRLERAKKLLALKETVNITLRCIEKVGTEVVPFRLFYGLRLPGSHIPGVVVAGTFYTRGGKNFYYIRDRKKCVTLNLKNHDYSQVVFEVEDKEKVAEKIRNQLP